jgi:hypothetical protein
MAARWDGHEPRRFLGIGAIGAAATLASAAQSSQFAGLLVATTARALAAQQPPLTLSHSWMVVTTGAPERKALERAGFRIARTVNRHDGQGTASVTVEFLNGFLELIYPDATVPVCDDLEGRRTDVSLEVRVARDRLLSHRHRLQPHIRTYRGS